MGSSEAFVAKQIPSSDLFVVYLPQENKEEVYRRLKSFGSIEDLDEENTLLLRVKTARSELQAQWRQLSDIVGTSGIVQPVLSDETGYPHYPTGELTVRFLKKPSDKELEKFAAKYKLRLRDRNEFVPEQAVFQLANPSATYLPDLIQKIAGDKKVKRAWANTRSRYRHFS
jgi:hypothetical protein